MKLGIGKRKHNRVNLSLTNKDLKMLKLLATSCGQDHTPMAYLLLKYCLENGQIMHEFQKKFNTNELYWVRPIHIDDGVKYIQG